MKDSFPFIVILVLGLCMMIATHQISKLPNDTVFFSDFGIYNIEK